MNLISVNEMKMMEDAANGAGFTYREMILAAGKGIAFEINTRLSGSIGKEIVGLVGRGNNGGDALAALTELIKAGWKTSAILIKGRKKGDILLGDYVEQGGKIIEFEDFLTEKTKSNTQFVMLDGIFGTGFRLPIPTEEEEKLRKVKTLLNIENIIAVDCPSGVDCETGEVSGGTLKADLTICLEAVKNGLVKMPACEYVGELVCVDLGIAKYTKKTMEPKNRVVDFSLVEEILPHRSAYTHKGTFGTVMIVGGSVNYPGAPVLAGKGAYAVGVGLVKTAVPERVQLITAGANPELTWIILDGAAGAISESAAKIVLENMGNVDCIVLGPGSGREESTKRFVQRLLTLHSQSKQAGFLLETGLDETRKSTDKPPIVIDADALVLLSQDAEWYKKIETKAVVTPHPGEMASLTGMTIQEIQADRMGNAAKFAQLWNQVVVLKGALTVVANVDGGISVIPIATSALAKGGSGDVLAGMIGGLIAQGLSCYEAAVAGAWVHGRAGILAGEMLGSEASVLATDIIHSIPGVLKNFNKKSLQNN